MKFLQQALPGALAGWVAIDVYMSAVYVAFGSTVLRLFQWDASTVMGHAAYAGGFASALLGLALDLVVSYGWACIALFAMTRLPAARDHALLFGVLFGGAVMFVMIWVVVPVFSRAQQGSTSLESVLVMLVGHTLFFGVPVTLGVNAGRRRTRTSAAQSGLYPRSRPIR